MPAKKTEVPEGKVLVNRDSLKALADNISLISQNIRGAYGSPGQISRETLITLLHYQVGIRGPIGRGVIQEVLLAMENLDKTTLQQRK